VVAGLQGFCRFVKRAAGMAVVGSSAWVEDMVGNAIVGVFDGIGKADKTVSDGPPGFCKRHGFAFAKALGRGEKSRVGNRALPL
jgi:hypothetical protein